VFDQTEGTAMIHASPLLLHTVQQNHRGHGTMDRMPFCSSRLFCFLDIRSSTTKCHCRSE